MILQSDSPLKEKDAACELRFAAGGNQTAEWGVDCSWVMKGGFPGSSARCCKSGGGNCINGALPARHFMLQPPNHKRLSTINWFCVSLAKVNDNSLFVWSLSSRSLWPMFR